MPGLPDMLIPCRRTKEPGTSVPSGYHELVVKATEILQQRRGYELPPLFNPAVIGQVFRFQSQPWEEIAQDHLVDIWNAVQTFLYTTLASITGGATLEALTDCIVDPFLVGRKAALDAKLLELLKPSKQGNPMTYNRGFSVAVNSIRSLTMTLEFRSQLDSVPKTIPNGWGSEEALADMEALQRGLSSTELIRMSAANVVDIMMAYYEVSNGKCNRRVYNDH